MNSTTITFDPPLPCSVLPGPPSGAGGAGGETQCGKPATAATLYPMGGGQFILQPICRECVAAIRWLYIDQAGERSTPAPAGPGTTPEEAEEQARQAMEIAARITLRGFEG